MGNEFWLATFGIAGTFFAGPLATVVNYRVVEWQRNSARALERSDSALQQFARFGASILEYRAAELRRIHGRLNLITEEVGTENLAEAARARRRECWQSFFTMSLEVRNEDCRWEAEKLIGDVEGISNAAMIEQAVAIADQVRVDLRNLADKVSDAIDKSKRT